MHIKLAAQMWLLGRILPLIVGGLVDSEDLKEDFRWQNFLLLMDIVDLLFAPMSKSDHVAHLAAQIEDHHLEFVRLYPTSSVIPKMHFMVHMPRLIVR